MSNTVRAWLGGLIAAASGGIAGMVGPAIVDSKDWVSGPHAIHNLTISAAITAAVNVFAYLAKSPLPNDPPAK